MMCMMYDVMYDVSASPIGVSRLAVSPILVSPPTNEHVCVCLCVCAYVYVYVYVYMYVCVCIHV